MSSLPSPMWGLADIETPTPQCPQCRSVIWLPDHCARSHLRCPQESGRLTGGTQVGKRGFPARIGHPGPVAICEPCCGHSFSSVVFNLCSVDAGVPMGYFPVYGGPPEEDLFANCLSFHWPELLYKLVQEWHVPPRHLPATVTFPGLAAVRLPLQQQHRCQEVFKISGDFYGLPEHFWPPSIPLPTLGQVQLSRYVWSVATLSWKASAVLGFAKNTDLRSIPAKPRWCFCFPSPSSSLSMPWPARRVGVSKSLFEDYCKFRLIPIKLSL